MNRRIFKCIFLVAIAVLLLTVLLTVGILYNSFTHQRFEELQNESTYIVSAFDTGGIDALELIKDNTSTRITLIHANGHVLYDSNENPDEMEDHSSREEFKEAIKSGTGESRRYSDTLSEETLYYAVRLDDGNILRVAGYQDSVFPMLLSVVYPLLAVVAVAVVLSFILASRMSKKIVEPINNIDLEHPEKENIYEELTPLINRLDAQNNQIQNQMQRIEQEHANRDKMRQEFTSNVAHELKTPLTSISGFAEIMRDGFVKDKDIQRFAGNIYKEAQRLIVLVGDIIKLSQLDEDEISASKEPVDLYDAAHAVLQHLQPTADKLNVQLILKGEHTLVMGVEQIIDEMIYNLCDNAVKYNKPGGTVTVITYHACIWVKDTGIGIASDEIPRVFERFYRVDKSHSKEIGGTGLGLSIVKHGAAYHAAKIDISSKVGEGTEIKLSF